MNIYLDIDGVLLAKDLSVANHASEFVKYMVKNYPVYWLTTHCKGDAMFTVRFFERFFDKETIDIMRMIRPTNWEILKTEAIDFSKPFLWFDDYLFGKEIEVLKEKNCLDSWICVDLKKNDNQLKEWVK
jgi:hypothetical protein